MICWLAVLVQLRAELSRRRSNGGSPLEVESSKLAARNLKLETRSSKVGPGKTL
jgi:hypothetical protein